MARTKKRIVFKLYIHYAIKRTCALPLGGCGLAERDSQQTRAQQHKAGRRQREESVGHKVMVTHHTSAAHDAGPNLLKISESTFLQKVLRAAAEVRPSNESRQMHGQGKSRR
jgi:hypothetical protein